jgi:hypothetical protein
MQEVGEVPEVFRALAVLAGDLAVAGLRVTDFATAGEVAALRAGEVGVMPLDFVAGAFGVGDELLAGEDSDAAFGAAGLAAGVGFTGAFATAGFAAAFGSGLASDLVASDLGSALGSDFASDFAAGLAASGFASTFLTTFGDSALAAAAGLTVLAAEAALGAGLDSASDLGAASVFALAFAANLGDAEAAGFAAGFATEALTDAAGFVDAGLAAGFAVFASFASFESFESREASLGEGAPEGAALAKMGSMSASFFVGRRVGRGGGGASLL